MKLSAKQTKILKRIMLYFSVLLILLMVLAPYFWQIISSITTQRELLTRPPQWIPRNPTIDRYILLLAIPVETTVIQLETAIVRAASNFRFGALNSMIVASITTFFALIFGTLSAYVISRLHFPGKSVFFFITIGTRMIPPISLVIPLYLILRSFGLIDTRIALIITYLAIMLPLVIWIMISFFKTVPTEIEDAALIDGCSYLGTLIRIILPLSKPGLISAAIVSFIFSWNEFFFALILTNTTASKTLPKVISEFSGEMGAGLDYGLVTAGGVITSFVPIAIALFLQKYIISGLTSGATKN